MNKYASEAVKLVDIPEDSEEYRRVIYSLQLGFALPTADIEVRKCAAIPSSFLGFSKSETDNSVILDAWFEGKEFLLFKCFRRWLLIFHVIILYHLIANPNTGNNQGTFNEIQ